MFVSLNLTRMGFGVTDLDRVFHQQGERGGHERANRGGFAVSGSSFVASWEVGGGRTPGDVSRKILLRIYTIR